MYSYEVRCECAGLILPSLPIKCKHVWLELTFIAELFYISSGCDKILDKINGMFYVFYQIIIYTPLMRLTLALILEIGLRLCCSNKNWVPELPSNPVEAIWRGWYRMVLISKVFLLESKSKNTRHFVKWNLGLFSF